VAALSAATCSRRSNRRRARRIDLGLALGNTKAPKRLIDTGGFKKRTASRNRIEITAPATSMVK